MHTSFGSGACDLSQSNKVATTHHRLPTCTGNSGNRRVSGLPLVVFSMSHIVSHTLHMIINALSRHAFKKCWRIALAFNFLVVSKFILLRDTAGDGSVPACTSLSRFYILQHAMLVYHESIVSHMHRYWRYLALSVIWTISAVHAQQQQPGDVYTMMFTTPGSNATIVLACVFQYSPQVLSIVRLDCSTINNLLRYCWSVHGYKYQYRYKYVLQHFTCQ